MKLPGGDNIIPLVMTGTGIYLVWFGVHYWRSGIKWPTDPVKSILQGSGVPAQQPTTPYVAAGLGATTQVNTATASSSAPPAAAGTGVTASQYTQVATFTNATLAALWTANGGSAATAKNAACHAMQESSGNPAVTSANPDGGTNVGLWQLDTRGKGAGYTVAQLQNPVTNARITIMATANGTNWSAWASGGCP